MPVLDRNFAYAVFARDIEGLRATVDLAEYVEHLKLDATGEVLARLNARGLDPRRLDPAGLCRSVWASAVSALELWVYQETLRRARIAVLLPPQRRPVKLNRLQITVPRARPGPFGKHGPNSTVEALGKTAFRYAFEQAYGTLAGSLARQTLQRPDKMAAAFAYVSNVDIWPAAADWINHNAALDAHVDGHSLVHRLRDVIQRRHQIVHRSDTQRWSTHDKVPIDASAARAAIHLIETVVLAITHVLRELPQHSVVLHDVWSLDVNAECSEEWQHAWDCDGFCEFSDLEPPPPVE